MNYIGDKYQIIRKLGAGAVGEVFLAKDLSQDDSPLVAVKLLSIKNQSDQYLQEFFSREVNALKQLDHPGIVAFYNSGYDENLNGYYLVIEYVDGTNLEKFISDEPIEIDSAIEITILILEALTYAHSKGVFHRDIKPENILVDQEAKPKLADFGVSKVYSVLTSGLTVRDFLSIPYAAPEQMIRKPADAKTDIYLVGAVLYKLLTGKDPEKDTLLEELIKGINLSADFEKILFHMVVSDLEQRYKTASQVIAELQKYLKHYKKTNEKHYLSLTNAVINKLYEFGFIRSLDYVDAKRFLETELGREVIAFYDTKYQSYCLLGRQLKLACKLDELRQKNLVVTRIIAPDLLSFERDKESGFAIQANWIVIKDTYPPDDYNIKYFLDSIVSYSKEKLQKKQSEITHKDLIIEWEKVLELHRELTFEQEYAIQYKSKDMSLDGDNIELDIGNCAEVTFNEEQSLLITNRGLTKTIHAGYFQDVLRRDDKNILVIAMTKDTNFDDIADQGEIVIDNRQIQSVLLRQQRALKSLKHKETVNPQLASILSNPQNAKRSNEALFINEYFNTLDQSKKDAVKNALLAKDIFLIQGPPGTGKTTVISELVAQITSKNEKAKILISSQSNCAVNHALMSISKVVPELPMIRIGRKEKISQGAEIYSYEERLKQFAYKTRNRSNKFAQDLKLSLNINNDLFDSFILLDEVKNKQRIIEGLVEQNCILDFKISENENIFSLIKSKNNEITQMNQMLLKMIDNIDDQSQLMFFLDKGLKEYIDFGKQILGLLSECSAIDDYSKLLSEKNQIESTIKILNEECIETCQLIRDALGIDLDVDDSLLDIIIQEIEKKAAKDKAKIEKYTKIESIRKEWLKRVENVNELEEACVKEAVVVAATCLGIAASSAVNNLEFDYVIVDEAGRATPPEVLVPMVRGQKIILVGDQKQLPPIVDATLSDQNLAKINITKKQLEETLFEKLYDRVNDDIKCTLLEQYRMHPAIGNLVSEVFYESKLVAKTDALCNNHKLSWWPKTILWFSTCKQKERFDLSEGTSKQNRLEANFISKLLDNIEKQYNDESENRCAAVITGYTAQKQLLRTLLDAENKKRWRSLHLEVDTVDAFQGRETDIVIYSIVRSNEERNLGFLKDYRRLNVALSRAKQLLIIVGDHQMAMGSVHSEYNPFHPVLNYIKQNSSDCLLEVIE